jgi:hypothetical protein
MLPSYLSVITGNEDAINEYIAGNSTLPHQIVKRLFKALYVRFPVNNQRFI